MYYARRKLANVENLLAALYAGNHTQLERSPILYTPQLDLNVSQHTKISTKLLLQKSCKYIQEVY